jgi:DNA-binding NarL/FixJ family response regulator
MKPRVLVIDDHPFFREGVVHWLTCRGEFDCCGEADSVRSARQVVPALKPDVILMDMRLGDGDGLDLAQEFSREYPASRIIMLSQGPEDDYAHRALRAGARGYVMKSEAVDVLITAIQTVCAGEIYLSRHVKARLLQNLFPDPVNDNHEISHLTDRELQVFQMLGAGCQARDIAQQLKISPKTVDTYREHLKEKLNLPDAAALLSAAKAWVEHH